MKKNLTPAARKLRKNMTEAELKLWYYLRNRQLGVKFRRQCPIEDYIVDFASFNVKLIIEVDGGQHADSYSDKARDKHLKMKGFKVLRFWNNDVLRNIGGVIENIRQEIPSPTPPASGGEENGKGK